ncbi:Pol polyprotein [Lonchura striata]|uniref:Pol polyprotein n=1 Tax=Lonchura striata TaxID=40157 RepID=A0A218VEC8_9PASE|nr:Pol polyprotein [Lonchura striata domestica]
MEAQVPDERLREGMLATVAKQNANEPCRQAILSLPLEPEPTLQAMLQTKKLDHERSPSLRSDKSEDMTKHRTNEPAYMREDVEFISTAWLGRDPTQPKPILNTNSNFSPYRLALTNALHLRDDYWHFVTVNADDPGTWRNIRSKYIVLGDTKYTPLDITIAPCVTSKDPDQGQIIAQAIPISGPPVHPEDLWRKSAKQDYQGQEFKHINGLLDTGADVTVIPERDWPSRWELQNVAGKISGVFRAATIEERPTQKLNWLTDTPVWMEQWPLNKQKLKALRELVEEQLAKGNIQETTSPWNSPIFVLKKPGKDEWRLLHDLRSINAVIEDMGSPQPGMPSLAMLPQNWNLAIIDIKNCFFQIPLHPDDAPRFAFSVPSINREAPMKRYHWRVLPQGMKNSPTTTGVIIHHYMDDILICAPNDDLLTHALELTTSALVAAGFELRKDKIQRMPPWRYLGLEITKRTIVPQKLAIKNTIRNLADVQQLWGDEPSSPRELTPEAKAALERVQEAMSARQAHRSKRLTKPQELVAELIRKARMRIRELAEHLLRENESLQFALDSYTGEISVLRPAHKIFDSDVQFELKITRIQSRKPLKALTVFTDASGGSHKSVLAELAAVVRAFERFSEPFNLVTDSAYVAGVVSRAQDAILQGVSNEALSELLSKLGNRRADALAAAPVQLALLPEKFQQAKISHQFHHQNAPGLVREFHLTRDQAKAIVATCPSCKSLPLPSKYVYVSVDTFSGAVFASAHTGERAKDVQKHLVQAFSMLGVPKLIKTDNAPGYTSREFAGFLQQWGIEHKTGIAYSPSGQAVVERTHQNIKRMLKQQLSASKHESPQVQLSRALFTLNFLNCSFECLNPPIVRHFGASEQSKVRERPPVLVKDPETWRQEGPYDLVTWGRGYACVSTPSGLRWVPSKTVPTTPGPPSMFPPIYLILLGLSIAPRLLHAWVIPQPPANAFNELAGLECWVVKQANLTSAALSNLLTDEETTRQATLQNRAAIDFLLLLHNHRCEEFAGLCCMNLSSKAEDVRTSISRMQEMIHHIQKESAGWLDSLFEGWGLTGWIRSLLQTGIVLLLGLIAFAVGFGVIKRLLLKALSNNININHATVADPGELQPLNISEQPKEDPNDVWFDEDAKDSVSPV